MAAHNKWSKVILKIYEQLDDYADTLNGFTNFDVTDEALEQLAS